MSSWLQALKRQLTFKSPKRDARAFAEIVEPLVIYPYSQKLDVSEAFLTGSDKDILELSKSEAKICHDAEQSALRFFGYTSEKGYAAWRTRRSFPPSASFFVKLHAWDLSGYGKLHFRYVGISEHQLRRYIFVYCNYSASLGTLTRSSLLLTSQWRLASGPQAIARWIVLSS